MNNIAYPLQWPAGWPRTEPTRRENPKFKATLPAALANLQWELSRMGARKIVLSSNYTLGASNPSDPGVVAYFEWCPTQARAEKDFLPMSIPCDRWQRIEANVQAIALTVKAMRGMERWGAKHMIRAMFTGFKLLGTGDAPHWSTVLGVESTAPAASIRARYMALVQQTHPDHNGGSHEEFVKVQRAWEEARREGAAS